MSLLSAQNIRLTRGDRDCLSDVSFQLLQGELVGLIGPNGAGKSSLLKLLAGSLSGPHSYQGEMQLEDQALNSYSRLERAQRIAYLPQDHAPRWPMRAWDVVGLGRLPQGRKRPNSDDEKAINRAMLAADCLSFADRSLDTLSGGERARVLMARALAVEADVLLADEPAAALDPGHQMALMNVLKTHCRDKSAAIIALHDLNLAARFCDRLLMLNEGRLVADGPAKEVLSAENLGSVYGIEVQLISLADDEFSVLPLRQTTV